MRKFFCSLLAIVFCSAAFSSASRSSVATQADSETEEYAVYSALLNEKMIGERTKLVVIKEETIAVDLKDDPVGRDSKYVIERLSPLSQATLDDYQTKNGESRSLTRNFDLKVNYVLLSKTENDVIFKEGPGGWKAFYEKYPDSSGYVGFSRVGFNRKMNQALVYVVHGCGGLCGTGNYVLLVKENGLWKVHKELNMWVS